MSRTPVGMAGLRLDVRAVHPPSARRRQYHFIPFRPRSRAKERENFLLHFFGTCVILPIHADVVHR